MILLRAIDFFVLAVALYWVLVWARRARALRMSLYVLAVHVAALIARRVGMFFTSWILDIAAILGAFLILVAFHREFRENLLALDAFIGGRRKRLRMKRKEDLVRAAFVLAARRLGALLILPRRDALSELVLAAVPFGAPITTDVLISVFHKNSPLHDGAAILGPERVESVGGILPLTQRSDLPSQYGTRHRAALGLSEVSDALVIVVSEERGEVRVASGGVLQRVESEAGLAGLLSDVPDTPRERRNPVLRMLVSHLRMKLGAAALAGFLWFALFFTAPSAVRTVSIPVEFVDVPPGLQVTGQSATRVEVEVNASTWLVDSISTRGLVAKVDLAGSNPGTRTIYLSPNDVELDPGMTVDRFSPRAVTVQLSRPN